VARCNSTQDMEIHVATELTSTTITNILEAVPGIKNVLRSPAADAMVNLTRAAAGVGNFDVKDARELLRFAFRRGLINNEEHDRVLAEIEVASQARQDRLAARRAARDDRGKPHRGPARSKPAKAVRKVAAHRAAAKAHRLATKKKAVRKPAARKPRPPARPKARVPKAKKRR
jgi:hypothetical protein